MPFLPPLLSPGRITNCNSLFCVWIFPLHHIIRHTARNKFIAAFIFSWLRYWHRNYLPNKKGALLLNHSSNNAPSYSDGASILFNRTSWLQFYSPIKFLLFCYLIKLSSSFLLAFAITGSILILGFFLNFFNFLNVCLSISRIYFNYNTRFWFCQVKN